MLRSLWFLFLTAEAASSQTFLAYQSADSGCNFLGHYQQGRFIDTTKTRGAIDPYTDAGRAIVPEFIAGRDYPAITARGNAVRILVTDVSASQDRPTYRFHANASEPVLITTAPLPLEVLPTLAARLTHTAERQIQARAKQLWERALSERDSGDRPSGYTMGKPQVETVGDGILVVYYPLNIEPLNDNRGSMFFLYSEKQHQIIRAEFGHPAWAFKSSVRTIKPEFYFRLRGSPDPYFLAEYSGGWGDWGYAILNLRTGDNELYCY
jgi:hypothetical protein